MNRPQLPVVPQPLEPLVLFTDTSYTSTTFSGVSTPIVYNIGVSGGYSAIAYSRVIFPAPYTLINDDNSGAKYYYYWPVCPQDPVAMRLTTNVLVIYGNTYASPQGIAAMVAPVYLSKTDHTLHTVGLSYSGTYIGLEQRDATNNWSVSPVLSQSAFSGTGILAKTRNAVTLVGGTDLIVGYCFGIFVWGNAGTTIKTMPSLTVEFITPVVDTTPPFLSRLAWPGPPPPPWVPFGPGIPDHDTKRITDTKVSDSSSSQPSTDVKKTPEFSKLQGPLHQ